MSFLSSNIISEFFVMVLKWAVGFINDYAVVILIVTFLLKLILLPLDLKQRRTTRITQLLTPEVESIRKRYANTPDQANKKIKELYAKNHAKPTAGCLPMLISMILLLAFYGAMRTIVSNQTVSILLNAAQNGVDNIQIPSFLWVHNVFQPDSGLSGIFPTASEFLNFIKVNSKDINPQTLLLLKNAGLINFQDGVMCMNDAAVNAYNSLTQGIIDANGLTGFNNGWFGLPIIAGGTLFLQQFFMNKSNKNPQPGGKFMMYFFPLFTAYICFTTNALFAMYWTFANIYSMAVQFITNAYYKNKDKHKIITAEDI